MSARWVAGGLRFFGWALALLLPALLIGGVLPHEPPRGPDREAAYRANNRGIRLTEQRQFPEALQAFQEAVRLAPHELPLRLHLGIAYLNTRDHDTTHVLRARRIFEAILAREPDNPHAHFCLAMVLQNDDEKQAIEHLRAVLRADGCDGASWYWLGNLLEPGSEEQTHCYRQALWCDRHLGSALYGLQQNLRLKEDPAATELLKEMEALKEADALNTCNFREGQTGPYGEFLRGASDPCGKPRTGPLPRLEPAAWTVQLAPGAHWTKTADLGRFPSDEFRRRVRRRFGATLAAFDYDGDGRVDLFLAGAVHEKGRVRDLLLRNDGASRFRDVTAAAGLAQPRVTLGCCVADFDNDGLPDLLLTGLHGPRLFRNKGHVLFEDVTAAAGLGRLTSVCLGAAFVDVDHDGKRDLLLCEYAATVRQARDTLRGESQAGRLLLFGNCGEPLQDFGDNRPSLACAFRRREGVPGLAERMPGLANLAVSDLDGDVDLDLLLCADGAPPAALLNDRLLRFHRSSRRVAAVPAAAWNGAVVFDADHKGRSDLLLLGAGQTPRLLLACNPDDAEESGPAYAVQRVVAPPLCQAMAVDLDLDGWTDVVAVAENGRLIFLHNKGGRLEDESEPFGDERPRDAAGVVVADVNGDGRPDVITWTESRGLRVWESRDNGNHALVLEVA